MTIAQWKSHRGIYYTGMKQVAGLPLTTALDLSAKTAYTHLYLYTTQKNKLLKTILKVVRY